MATRAVEAATILGGLVPGCVDDSGHFSELTRDEFWKLSTGERAAYQLATSLYFGGGELATFVAFADQRFAGVLIGALTVALGDRLVPVFAATLPADEVNDFLRALDDK